MNDQSFTDYFLKLAHSKVGAVVQWAVGGFMGYLISWALKLGYKGTPEFWNEVDQALTVFGAFVATAGIQWYQNKQAKKVQRALEVKQDGWIDKKTVKAAEQATP